MENAIYDSYAMRIFMGIDFYEQVVPDATTLLKVRHLLERHQFIKTFFEAIKCVMVESDHMMKGGTIVDATIIQSTSSTKFESKSPFISPSSDYMALFSPQYAREYDLQGRPALKGQ